ncbi:MAG: dephospho-CoA kinase [Phycisphaerae bacterium]|nr:dephospho-CoA kinase [Phycisphaerae bacterium]
MRQDKNIPVIGIVGGVGSGKSTVAEEFERRRCRRIDGDKLGHALLANDDVKREIRSLWGDAVFDETGAVSRRAVAEIVFQDAEQLAALERILHPRIRAEIVKALSEAQATDCPAVVIDAAVLFEAGWDDLCTHVVFVDAPEKDRLQRVGRRLGWDAETLRRREARQIPLDKKAKRCHHSLSNCSSVSHLQEQVDRLLHLITRE